MKPETALFLEKSRDLLGRADRMMGARLTAMQEGRPILPDSMLRKPSSLRPRIVRSKSIQVSKGNFRGWSKTIRALTAICGRSSPALTNSKRLPII